MKCRTFVTRTVTSISRRFPFFPGTVNNWFRVGALRISSLVSRQLGLKEARDALSLKARKSQGTQQLLASAFILPIPYQLSRSQLNRESSAHSLSPCYDVSTPTNDTTDAVADLSVVPTLSEVTVSQACSSQLQSPLLASLPANSLQPEKPSVRERLPRVLFPTAAVPWTINRRQQEATTGVFGYSRSEPEHTEELGMDACMVGELKHLLSNDQKVFSDVEGEEPDYEMINKMRHVLRNNNMNSTARVNNMMIRELIGVVRKMEATTHNKNAISTNVDIQKQMHSELQADSRIKPVEERNLVIVEMPVSSVKDEILKDEISCRTEKNKKELSDKTVVVMSISNDATAVKNINGARQKVRSLKS